MFVIVAVVAAIKTSSDGVVIQRDSSRRPRATDFRLVQGALNAGGVGILLSGIAATPPVIAYLPSSVSLINLTGVAARSVGYAIGGIMFALAFLPKLTAVLLAVPGAVMGAFLLIIMGLLFVEGIRTVVQDGLDPQKGLVARGAGGWRRRSTPRRCRRSTPSCARSRAGFAGTPRPSSGCGPPARRR